MFQDFEIPFQKQGNECFLTRTQILENEELANFFRQFRHLFEVDYKQDIAFYRPEGT